MEALERFGKEARAAVSGVGCPGVQMGVFRWQNCQEWDSNPRLQGRLRPERSALDRSAILTAGGSGPATRCSPRPVGPGGP